MEPRAANALDESIRAAIGEVQLDEDVEDDIRELNRVPGRDKAKAAVNSEEGQSRRNEQKPLEENVESGARGLFQLGET
ncbi:hypothetical protein DVH05_005821 [Phytophthora capsici]|nr:hypothetical protein DVH05_005821 [Phytophthora capsici]